VNESARKCFTADDLILQCMLVDLISGAELKDIINSLTSVCRPEFITSAANSGKILRGYFSEPLGFMLT
jgi:hypothetical protein